MLHAPTTEAKTETAQSKSQLAPLSKQQCPSFLHSMEGQHTLSDGIGNAISNHAPRTQRYQTVAGLQATYGNQAVLRTLHTSPHVARMTPLRPSQGVMLQRKCACGGLAESTGECAECKAKREGDEAAPILVQAKLNVGEPEDVYEQEANKVGESAMRMAVPRSPLAPATSDSSTAMQATMSAPAIVHEVLSSNGGQPLDEATRAFMEPRFGYDFGQVRVHTDEQAAKSAEVMNALAYTVGRDVVFGAGQYAPGTMEGKALLTHELTHVVQQRGGAHPSLQRLANDDTEDINTEDEVFVEDISDDAALEEEADLTSQGVLLAGPIPKQQERLMR